MNIIDNDKELKPHNLIKFEPNTSGKAMIYYLVGVLVLSILVAGLGFIPGLKNSFLYDTVTSVLGGALFVVVFFMLYKAVYTKPLDVFKSEIKFSTSKTILIYAICLVAMISILFLASPLATLFTQFLESNKITGGVDVKIDTLGKMFVCLITFAVVPAVLEELFFRGIILKGLSKFKPILQIIICGSIFMLMHASLFQSVYQLLLGVVITTAVVYSKDVKIGIGMHFINNAIVVVNTYLLVKRYGEPPKETMQLWLAIILFIIACLIVVGLVVVLQHLTKKERSYTNASQIETNKFTLKEVEFFLVGCTCIVALWVLQVLITIFSGLFTMGLV